MVVFCKASLLHESMKGDDTPKNVVRVSVSSKKSLSTFCSPLVVIALLLLHIKKFVDTQSCCSVLVVLIRFCVCVQAGVYTQCYAHNTKIRAYK